MLITITTTHQPATDLGYLLHKNPGRIHEAELSFGVARVFYPEASPERCTAAVLLDIDPVALVRGKAAARGAVHTLDQYVNDRPYACSSFMSVAIADLFSTTMSGRSKERQELADTPIPIEAVIYALPCRSGESIARRIFEPLGYQVELTRALLDDHFPDWGPSPYFNVSLTGRVRLRDLLTHLYVLIPAVDSARHYYVGAEEVEKLLKKGEGWLAGHPERDLIVTRYLQHKSSLTRAALARLIEDDPDADDDEVLEVRGAEEEALERPVSLHSQRLGAVMAALKQVGAARVLDLGCGEGRLLSMLLDTRQFTEIVGMDVSYRVLERASDKLRLSTMAPRKRERLKLLHGSLIYRDERLGGYDAAAVVEVIEHLDPPRLAAFERALFRYARPRHIVVITPNFEYNVKFETRPAGRFRHKDHRFEWTRAQFDEWTTRMSGEYGYTASLLPIGDDDPRVGPPSQMVVFTRNQDE